MSQVLLKGNAISTSGELPKVGSAAPDFRLTKSDMGDVSLKDFVGKKILLNIYPSIDTGICATSVRKFNVDAAGISNTVVVGVSRDTPFALGRFCGAEGIDKVVTTSELRDLSFGERYGVRITSGGMAGLLARSVVVIDANGKVAYTELVPEIVSEPNYQAALDALKKA